MAASKIPKVFVFDLDNCVWDPEMFELWGGGSPFKSVNDGEYLVDRRGTKVSLMGDVREVLKALVTEEKYNGCEIAVASCCDEPSWGRECIQKFKIDDGVYLKDVFKHLEIYKGSKSGHLKTIARKTGAKVDEMIFFDDQWGNCQTVAKLGVTVVHTPDNGVTWENFKEGLRRFPNKDGSVIGDTNNRGKWW